MLSATVLVAPAFASVTNQTQDVKLQNPGEYLLAQMPNSCRQVIANNGLNVRQEATTNSKTVGIIGSGRTVTIQSLGENG